MKIKSIYTIACASLTLCMASCISDDSTLGGIGLAELSIKGSTDETMPVKNFDLGNDCVIEPEISYKGNEELSYEWSIGTYVNGAKGDLKIVSRDKVLTYAFTEGGSYYAHLAVTDGKVGQTIDYQVNINRTFENGYVLVSNDEAGNGNMAFIKILTMEEQESGVKEVRLENCLSKMNEGMMVKNLKDVAIITMTWPTTYTRIVASVENKCYFLDPNTFNVITEINYEDVFPGFKATCFMTDSYSPYAYDAAMGKYVHLDLEYMFPYEYKYYKGAQFDDIYPCVYNSSWAGATLRPIFVNYNPSTVSEVNFYGTDTYFPSTGELLKDEDILSVFIAKEMNNSWVVPAYILTRSKLSSSKLNLFTSAETYISPTSFTQQSLTLTDDMAVPAQGTRFVVSPKYDRYFYNIDNNVYVFLTENTFSLAKKSQPAINFPANEEITCLVTNFDTEELYVATYDRSTKRGNFYIFDTKDVRADSTISPEQAKEVHKDCADRITNILYKPSIN